MKSISLLLFGILAITVFVPMIDNAFAYTVSGYKFDDIDGSGTQNGAEPMVDGVSISLNNTNTNFGVQITGNTGDPGYYEFTVSAIGDYIIAEKLPSGKIFTTPPIEYFTINTMSQTYNFDFGNRDLLPLPQDMTIPSMMGLLDNGVPTNGRNSLTVTKDLSSFCTTVNDVFFEITTSDGTVFQGTMQNMGNNVWSITINGPFSGGTASFEAFADCGNPTSGFPLNPSVDTNDVLQVGDLVFIDPSGTVIDGCNGLPKQNAKVTLYWLNPNTNKFEIPPTEYHIPATNPLYTDENGDYAWMTTSGTYMVKASKLGYAVAESAHLVIPPPRFDVDLTLQAKSVSACGNIQPNTPFNPPCPNCPMEYTGPIIIPFIVLGIVIAFSFYSIAKNPGKPQK